jgi:aspartate carbamoyltransferase catalytic subunit
MGLYHILETQQFKDRKVLEELFSLADQMKLFDKPNLTANERKQCYLLGLPQEPRKKIMACLFYEPSTRTRFSFETAMKRLGGETISTESAGMFSSAVKGESIGDMARITGQYADIIVMRHKMNGAATEAAAHSPVPVINAGDGSRQHPTQSLLDAYTINDELGRMDDLEVAMLGDLNNGRTVHSLAYLLAHRKGIKLYFISPKIMSMPHNIREYLQEKNIPFEEMAATEKQKIEDVLQKCDVLYVTRVQKERIEDKQELEEYEKYKEHYIVNNNWANLMKTDSIIMHPLPRVDEIAVEVDQNPKAAYFRQAANGLYVRMALLKMILDPKSV